MRRAARRILILRQIGSSDASLQRPVPESAGPTLVKVPSAKNVIVYCMHCDSPLHGVAGLPRGVFVTVIRILPLWSIADAPGSP